MLEEVRPRVLVLVSGRHNTEIIAAALCAGLRLRGLDAELGDATAAVPPPADYDAVVIGITLGLRLDAAVESYIARFREGLSEIPVALFFLGSPHQCAHALLRADHSLGRAPDLATAFPHRTFPRWRAKWIDPLQITEFSERLVEHLRIGHSELGGASG